MVGETNREEMLSQGDPPTGILPPGSSHRDPEGRGTRVEGEEELTRLLASAQPPVAPSPELKKRLFSQLAASLQGPVGQVQKESPPVLARDRPGSVPTRLPDRLAGFLRGIATTGQTPARRLVVAAGAATAALFLLVMGVRLLRQATVPAPVTLAEEFPDVLCAEELPGPLRLPGLASPGDSVDIFINGDLAATVNADAQGKFTYAQDRWEEGSYEVVARATNRRGYVSQEGMLAQFAIDCTHPDLLIIEPWGPKVASSQVVLTGRTEPGAQIKVGELEVTADSEGLFSAMLELVPGRNEVIITATDKADNNLEMLAVFIYEA